MFCRGDCWNRRLTPKAITVLQRGVSVGANGIATAMVVGADGKVEAREIK